MCRRFDPGLGHQFQLKSEKAPIFLFFTEAAGRRFPQSGWRIFRNGTPITIYEQRGQSLGILEAMLAQGVPSLRDGTRKGVEKLTRKSSSIRFSRALPIFFDSVR